MRSKDLFVLRPLSLVIIVLKRGFALFLEAIHSQIDGKKKKQELPLALRQSINRTYHTFNIDNSDAVDETAVPHNEGSSNKRVSSINPFAAYL